MKILMVCAGGLSTGILVNKLKKYWASTSDEPLEMEAVSLAEYKEVYPGYEMILVGPQIAYRLESIKEESGLPCAVINSTDYALGRCENIFETARNLTK